MVLIVTRVLFVIGLIVSFLGFVTNTLDFLIYPEAIGIIIMIIAVISLLMKGLWK